MNKDNRTRVVDRHTGMTRFVEGGQNNGPRRKVESEEVAPQSPVEVQPGPTEPSADEVSVTLSKDSSDGQLITESVEANEPGVDAAQGKKKQEIQNFEQFIAQAYGGKGRRVALKGKVEKAVAENLHLSPEAVVRLLQLAQGDKLFAVPRQLMLACREVRGYPALRAALRDFVGDVMLRHPIFKRPELESAIRNLPDTPSCAKALAIVFAADLKEPQDAAAATLKPVELDELRANAANCLLVWLSDTKQLPLSELIEALNYALWAPSARDLSDEGAKLRALTEIGDLPGVGLVCELYRQQAREKSNQADQASQEAVSLKAQVARLESQLSEALSECQSAKDALELLRTERELEVSALRTGAQTEAAHLRDDIEQLRSRLLRRLVTDVEQLEVGLTAIRSPEPRIHVMQDRVERVVDALRAELNKLREE